MSWQDTTTITIPIRAMGVTPSGQPMPLVALADVIKLLESYGMEVENVKVG
jgi:hypothetical protein